MLCLKYSRAFFICNLVLNVVNYLYKTFSVKTAVDKGVKNMNNFIDQYSNMH